MINFIAAILSLVMGCLFLSAGYDYVNEGYGLNPLLSIPLAAMGFTGFLICTFGLAQELGYHARHPEGYAEDKELEALRSMLQKSRSTLGR